MLNRFCAPADQESRVPEGVDLVIFPEFADGEIGVYRVEQLLLKKRLERAGVRADYFHTPSQRTWLREQSKENVVDIAVGLGVAAGHDRLRGRSGAWRDAGGDAQWREDDRRV